jgi:alanyl-tRNA synthetase
MCICLGLQYRQSRSAGIGSTSTATGDAKKAPNGDAIREWRTAGIKPVFTGLTRTQEPNARIVALDIEDDVAWMVIDPCPFYPIGGGQVGDKGTLEFADGQK